MENKDFDIAKACKDPKIFGSLFIDPSTWEAWMVFFKTIFALPMDEKEFKLYQKFTERKELPKKPFKRIFCIAGRGSGKSSSASLLGVYLSVFHDWTPHLRPGEYVRCPIIATDRSQARIILDYIKGIFNDIPIFKNMVEKEMSWEIRLKNRVIIQVMTCSTSAPRGYGMAFACAEEASFWRDESSANPDRDIVYGAILPCLSRLPGSIFLAISTPYSRQGIMWDAYDKYFGKDDENTLVWVGSTLDLNPNFDKSAIEEAMETDSAVASSEYFATFRQDLSSLMPYELIESAVDVGITEREPKEDVTYFAGVDPSGGARDSFCLAIAHSSGDDGNIVLDFVKENKSPQDPRETIREFSAILREWGIDMVTGDKYGSGYVFRAFNDEYINYEYSELNKSLVYLELLPLMSQKRVRLLDNKRLTQQLAGLERRARSTTDSVDHAPNGKDDLINAAALAIVGASRYSSPEIMVLG